VTWINLPFTQDNQDLILKGIKRATSRQHPKGKTGDFFKVGEATFVIERVESHTLGFVADNLYKDEGLDSPQGFVDVWNGIATGMAAKWGDNSKFPFFEPSIPVWTHFFCSLEEWERKRPRWW
jgi:hypothetical protein